MQFISQLSIGPDIVNANKEICPMEPDRKTFDVGRDSKTGLFITVKEANRRPRTTTVERVPKPGRGDTKDEPRRKH